MTTTERKFQLIRLSNRFVDCQRLLHSTEPISDEELIALSEAIELMTGEVSDGD